MAPKRLLEDPPPASSSEDEEETEDDAAADEDEEDGDSEGLEDEQDEDNHQNKKPKSNETPATKSLKASQEKSASDSGDESGSETESDDSRPSPSASAFTIKPIASKPMKDSVKPQKNSANRKLAVTPAKTVTVTGGVKRSSESDDLERKESKKNKVSSGQDEDSKRGSVPRLWSEGDEVVILKGMIDYQTEKGADPWTDMEAFLGFIKENLHADVSKDQLKNKIKRLKQKYQSNAEKGKNGEAPALGKLHDSRLFDLSKRIWGASVTNGVDDSAKKKRKPTQSETKTSASTLPNGEINAEPAAGPNSSFFDALLVQGKLLSMPEGAANVMKEALPLIGSSKTKELESKWKKLQEDECKLFIEKLKLVRDSAKLMLEAMQSSTS